MISMPSFRCSFLIQNQALLPRGMPWIACSRLAKWAGSFDGAWQTQVVERCGKHGTATTESTYISTAHQRYAHPVTQKRHRNSDWIKLNRCMMMHACRALSNTAHKRHVPISLVHPATQKRHQNSDWIKLKRCMMMHACRALSSTAHKRHVPNYLCNLPRVPKLRLDKAAPARLS